MASEPVDIEVNQTKRALVLDLESERDKGGAGDMDQVENEEVTLKEVIETIMNKG